MGFEKGGSGKPGQSHEGEHEGQVQFTGAQFGENYIGRIRELDALLLSMWVGGADNTIHNNAAYQMYANLAGGQIDLGLTPSNVREKVKDFQCSQKEKPKGEPIVVVSQATFPDKPLFKGIVMSVCENGYVEFDTGPAPSTSQN